MRCTDAMHWSKTRLFEAIPLNLHPHSTRLPSTIHFTPLPSPSPLSIPTTISVRYASSIHSFLWQYDLDLGPSSPPLPSCSNFHGSAHTVASIPETTLAHRRPSAFCAELSMENRRTTCQLRRLTSIIKPHRVRRKICRR